MSKFDIKLNKQGEKFDVSMSGTIDEDVDFTAYNLNGAKEVNLDLTGVKGINSCGIREWIKWIGTSPNAKIVYSNCPKVIVDQINMVDGFLPSHGRVTSFYVPYYNDESGSEKNVLFSYGKEFSDNGIQAPADIKDDDGNVMEMDVIEAKYFKFLKK